MALFQHLRDIKISEILITTNMRLYECVEGRFKIPQGLSNPIQSTIRVKKACPLSTTLFNIYVDELEAFLYYCLLPSDGCYLHQVLISILLFANDVILLASSPNGLQWLLDGLASFWDSRELVLNLGKT